MGWWGRWLYRAGESSRAVDDYSRREVAVVEVCVGLLVRRHHLVDLVAENAPHIREQLRERLRLRRARSRRFSRRSFNTRVRRAQSINQRGLNTDVPSGFRASGEKQA